MTQAPDTNTTAASQYEALEAATSSVERQPQFVVIQFAILLTLFALLLVFSRQHRRAALKGNGTASRKIVLPALEPILSTLCLVSMLITGGFAVVLVEQTDSANVSALVNEIAYSGKQFVLVLVLAHMVQRQLTTHALWSSILLALVLSCYTIPVAWCLNSASEPFPSSQAYFWTLSAARAFLLFFYIKIVIRPPSSRAFPGSTREYCAFAVTSHVLLFAVDAISHSGKDASADALAYTNLVLMSLCPLFIWRVLRSDTEHWRRTASHTCELHSKLLLELKGHAIRISRVQFLQERVSPQGLHLHIEMQPKLVLDFGALEIKQRLVSNKRKPTCAQVFSGVLHSCTAVAVKVYTPANFADETLARFAHEAALCGALHHPNIVRFYGMCVSPPSVSFVTELCTVTLRDVLGGMAGDLASYTHPTKYHFLVQLGYILDATRAVAYLHSFSPAFLHRDLRPTSFVVDQDGNVKLTDLGEAKNLPHTQYRDSSDLSQLDGDFSLLKSPRSAVAVMPPPIAFDPSESSNVEYTPPEVLSNLVGSGSDSQYEEAIDVFALAMIMWDVLHPDCERFPSLRSGDTQSIAQAVAGGYRPKIALHVHPCVCQLIESSWEQDARLRPSTQYIVSVLETIQEEVMNDLAGELYSDLGGQFYGEEAVLHLIRSRRVTGKPQAIRLGNALMDAGVLHHVNHSKGFEVCKYGVYYVDESSLTQQTPHRDTQARIVAAAELGLTDQDRSTGEPSASTMPANHHPKRPRQLTIDSNDSFASTSPHATNRVHCVESFEPDQLRLIDSTLCACRRLGQRMEEPAKLVRRTRRPTPRLLEEENSLTADLLTDTHASSM